MHDIGHCACGDSEHGDRLSDGRIGIRELELNQKVRKWDKLVQPGAHRNSQLIRTKETTCYGINPTLWQPGSIPAHMLPLGGTATRHRKDALAERLSPMHGGNMKLISMELWTLVVRRVQLALDSPLMLTHYLPISLNDLYTRFLF
ncbi:hypothetical protein T265_03545 [Opisthorchis viverrini]|uniref:Uncharacterized protein n=1 Tax=Opisthorchis viverrini TaxID=6198 RepID=A0A074ZRB7_OPIVI|nr:hypothetical protein T265_03545 [Opisthorchis viverrini]KER29958.1 hypothetical protein T265_03545 [Opisthorchis viverrini]